MLEKNSDVAKNVKSLLEQLKVCIFAEIVFGVRCTLKQLSRNLVFLLAIISAMRGSKLVAGHDLRFKVFTLEVFLSISQNLLRGFGLENL